MLALITAFLFDLKFGDPVYPYHPARLMGHAVSYGETIFRNYFLSSPNQNRLSFPRKRESIILDPRLRGDDNGGFGSNEKTAGAILALSLPIFVFLLASAVITIFDIFHPLIGFAASVFGIYSSISARDLDREGLRVLRDLRMKNLPAARQSVGRIVGRDTENLDAKEVTRAAVEAISESTVDGIIAPLFFAALGGAPLALAYKAVNTLDSMIGHQNERYRHFGFFAAKQDEMWNWLPARISCFIIPAAAYVINGRMLEAFFAGWEHGVRASGGGNSAVPEAAFAGALGLRLGGPSTYQGRVVEKNYLGFPTKDFDSSDVEKSLELMMATAWISLGGAVLLKGFLGVISHA